MAEVPAFLKALTPEARACLGAPMVQISRYPFRVGRESRVGPGGDFPDPRRRQDSVPNNDLYLFEPGPMLNVSREHFQIEIKGGQFVLVDRGSACGTLVEGELVGGEREGGKRKLENNDVIVVGTSTSRYIFKFVVAEVP